jgi:hypothetical protein
MSLVSVPASTVTTAVPLGLTGTLAADHKPLLTPARTPLTQMFRLSSLIVPLTVTFVLFNWLLEIGLMPRLTLLSTTSKVFVLTFPAALEITLFARSASWIQAQNSFHFPKSASLP